MILHYIMCFGFGLFVGAIAVGGCKFSNNLEELSLLDDYCKSLEDRIKALEKLNMALIENKELKDKIIEKCMERQEKNE